MAIIAEDPSTPSPTHQGAGSSGAATSNNFSPPSGSLVVVLVNVMYYNGVHSSTLTCQDSLSNSYSAGITLNSSSNASTIGIFYKYYVTAPGNIHVTVTNSSTAGAAYLVSPRVLTGAASSQTGAASASFTSEMQNSLTTTTSGSWVYVVAGEPEDEKQSVSAGTKTLDSWLDEDTGDGTYIGRTTNATITPGGQVLGWSGNGDWAALEILPSTSSASVSGGGNVTIDPVSIAGSGFFTTGGQGAIVQQVPGTSTYDYGWSTTQFTNSPGNTLVVVAAWNLNTTFTSGPMPAVYVLDDAYNYWYHVATTTADNTGSRSAVWVCPNARQVSWISCSLTTFASSLAYTIIELGNMSPYYSLDVVDTVSLNSASSVSSNPLTATAQDVAFSVIAIGSTSAAITSSPSGWTGLTGVASGSSGQNSIALYPFFKSSVVKGNALQASYGMNIAAPVSVITFGLVKNGYPPVQLNENFPVVKVEMGFGFLPGDPSQAPPTWVDITSRCIGNVSSPVIEASMGRTYELTTQEAGTLTIGINNSDGAFTPGNVNSPYYPNVTVGTPVRVSAFWSGAFTKFWDFEDGNTDSWAGTGASVSVSSTWSYSGFYSLEITSTGASQWFGHSPLIPVGGLVNISATAQVFTPTALGHLHLNIDFYDVNKNYISTASGSQVSTNGGAVSEIFSKSNITTPGNNGFLRISVVDSETSPSGTSMFTDSITLSVQPSGAGNWYHIGFGYVERWPQEWPDMPQWGLSRMVASDVFGVMNNTVLLEALDGDILLDGPYVYIPGSEQYSTVVNGLTPVFTASEAQGLLAANYSRLNQRSGTYVDGTAAQLNTGNSTTLLGSENTGFGTSSINTAPTIPSSGPGMIYWDPALPSPTTSAFGLTVEFWVNIGSTVGSSTLQPTIFAAFGPASNYQVASPSLALQVLNLTGNNNLLISFRDGSSITATFSPSLSSQQIVLTMTSSSITVYIDGALSVSSTLTASQVSQWSAVMLGCANYAYTNGSLVAGNYTAMSLAIYNYILPMQRIVSHYTTGVTGQQNVDATARIAQLLSWSYLGIPRGGQYIFNGVTDGVGQGPAYGLNGSHVADAVNQVATNHQALAYAAADGTLRFKHRWGLFNQTPQYTFGDSNNPGEIPFMPGQAFSYDVTYLYNVEKVSQTTGPTQGITVQTADFNSRSQYFERSALSIGIQTTSNLDVYDIANWTRYNYAQPNLRIQTLGVDSAADPTTFFAVLQTNQGDAAIVNRRPLGGAVISANVLVQKVTRNIGPGLWQTQYEMSPYNTLSSILEMGTSNSTLGGNTLA